jgi:hypothetical protein
MNRFHPVKRQQQGSMMQKRHDCIRFHGMGTVPPWRQIAARQPKWQATPTAAPPDKREQAKADGVENACRSL